jgi:apolipoprotein N-acyltransferase
VIAAVNALWLVRIRIQEGRFAKPLLIAGGAVILVACFVSLRRLQLPVREGATGVATLVQENLEVGQAAASAGPSLTQSQKLAEFSRLSLFPDLSYCSGVPELASTRCIRITPLSPAGLSVGLPVPADLIVWPEAPNDFFDSAQDLHVAISTVARSTGAPVIVGDMGVDRDPAAASGYELYNSASFFRADGNVAGRYDKMHLVPFGEYTPYKKLFFFAGSLLQSVGLFEPGKQRVVFSTGGHNYGTFICYESIFPDEVRQFVKLGADVLVNISDDGWYGDTSAAWEHLNMVRMRAIENHRWVLRATNTGVTASIDPYGRVVQSVPRHIRTSLRAGFDYEHDVTFYTAHGDLFAYLCSLVTAAALGLALLR